MPLLYPEDPYEDENAPKKGFDRYRQLLSVRFRTWWKIDLLTLAGFAPLAAGIFCAVASKSLLVLLPCSILGGAIAGPFLAGMYDALMRGFRNDPRPWWDCYKLSWKQNWKSSLIPGALLGLFLGVFVFMAMLFWVAERAPSAGTVVIYLAAFTVVMVVNSLYWPQLVMFDQRASVRLKNCLLFCIKYFLRALGSGLVQLVWWVLFVLFAPWTLLLLPLLGVWYILFLSQFVIFEQMSEAFGIEPWAA